MNSDSKPKQMVGSAENGLEDLLSIDVDAELTKLCASSFKSPHHWPVELVRAAVARGATAVEIRLARRRIEISDNGSGIDPVSLNNLCVLLGEHSPRERQEALSFFERQRGLGLLAALASGLGRVTISNHHQGRSLAIAIEDNSSLTQSLTDEGCGTQCVVATAGVSEKGRVLRDYCRYAQVEIRLDGKLISQRTESHGALSSVSMELGDGLRWGVVSIPQSGDTCRVWLLHQGILRKHSVTPPRHGLVFEVVAEYRGPPPPQFSRRVCQVALQLYQGLLRGYHSSSAEQRERIEELVFWHYRHSGDSTLLRQGVFFQALNPRRFLTLEQLQQESGSRDLFALRDHDQESKYDTDSGLVLVLTSRQWEFLSKHIAVRLSPPLLKPRPEWWLFRLSFRLRSALRAVAERLSRRRVREVPRAELAQNERALLDRLRQEIGSGRFELEQTSAGDIRVVMSDQRRSKPTSLVSDKKSNGLLLAIFRQHPVVCSAVTALAQNGDNIHLIMPALLDGRDGWR